MWKRRLLLSAIAGALSLALGGTVGAQNGEQVYGSQLMTQQERAEYSARMRNAKTPEEREQIRQEHHQQMQARAKERGVTLPDEPPARGMGSGRGAGPGSGMGPGGGGMGPGGGMGSGGYR